MKTYFQPTIQLLVLRSADKLMATFIGNSGAYQVSARAPRRNF